MKKQSFLYGAGVLAAASILCKIMSAVFKIPLDRFFLHEEGIAVYQSAYSVYNVFLAICVTGIPVGLSNLIAKSDEKESQSLCRSTFVFVTIIMSVCGILLFCTAEPLARILSGGGEPLAAPSLRILAVSLPSMGLISSRRGYFQGKGNMTPSALSQLTESFFKVALGILGCAFFIRYGISYGAAGAILGVCAGSILSGVVLEIFFFKNTDRKAAFSAKKALKVIKISIPMTLGAFGFTAVLLTDTFTVPKLLSLCGADSLERLRLFGYLTRANTVYNLPATVISAVTASAVPSVAAAYMLKDAVTLSETVKKAVRVIFLVAAPCMMGMLLFSGQILYLLYGSQEKSELLMLAGVMALIMPYVQTTTAILQTLGKVWFPIAVTMAGVLLKTVLNVFFVQSFGVDGAIVSTIVAFGIVFVINTFVLCRYVNMKGILKPIAGIFMCAVASCGIARLIYSIKSGLGMLLICVALAAMTYIFGVIILGCIKKEDL